MILTGENIRHFAQLPVNDPVLVFALILLIILVSPVLLRKIRIPAILGLIVSGIIIGPNGLNIIERGPAMDLLSTVGMLFLMFIAGLDLDQQQFRRTKYKSLLFGLLTYTIPFGIGLPVCYYLLDYNLLTSLMISNMFATHTMVSYPVVSRLGLTKNEAVAVATGGTVITDTLVLLVLAVITGSTTGETGLRLYGTLIISFLLLLIFIIYIIPAVSKWVFRHLEDDNYSQFIYVALVVFISAFAARIAGLEPIIGAFGAGFMLNRLIPAESILRNRIDFTGNSLFIPFFLISVGMIVDPKIIFLGPMAVIIAAVLTTVALAGKWAASEMAARILKFSKDQRRLLFGLTSSHAAAILAVIMVGYRIGIIDENVINGTIVLIIITCLVSSFVTENAGRRLVLNSNGVSADPTDLTRESIIVSLSNPSSMERLLDLALTLKKKNHNNPLYGLCVVPDDEAAGIKLSQARATLEQAGMRALSSGRKIETIATIDNNSATGIKRVAREKGATDIIVGVSGRSNLTDFLFGRSLEQLLINSSYNTFVYNPVKPLHLYIKVVVVLPPHVEKEPGFIHIIDKVTRLAAAQPVPLESYSYGHTFSFIENHLKEKRNSIIHNFFIIPDDRDLPEIRINTGGDDLLVIVSPQRESISYEQSHGALIKKTLRETTDNGYLIIYPALIMS